MSVSNRPVALASINSSAWVRYLRVRFALEALAVLLSAAVNPPDAPARNPAADSRPHGSPVPVRPFDPLMPAVVNPRPLMPGCHRVDGTAVIRGTSSAWVARSPASTRQPAYVSMGRTPMKAASAAMSRPRS